MKYNYSIIALMLALLVLTIGCQEATQAGSFEVKFTWADGPPVNPGDYYAYTKVEQRQEGLSEGRVVAESDVARFSLDQWINLPNVPNGSDYILVFELKTDSSKTFSYSVLWPIQAVFAKSWRSDHRRGGIGFDFYS